MRHAISTPRYVTIASWLVVTGVGLAIGAIGAGGLRDLVVGSEPDAEPVVLTVEAPGSAATPSPGATAADTKELRAGKVVSPSQVPDGTAIDGRAPDGLVAQEKDYVPFEPTSIRLPSGKLAPIQAAGVHDDGALDVPENPGRVGWWTGGAQAGEPYGSMVLAGHVDSASFGLGALSEMLKMRPGQELKVADGAHGQVYRVKSIRKVLKAKLTASADLFDQDVKHRLVMITCGGPFDQRTHRYRDNVVIVATPVS